MTHVEAAPPLHWDGQRLHILDQTRLPDEEAYLTLRGADDTAEAIRRLAVRGAPLIGVAAAYGLAMEVSRTADYEDAAARLAAARPTARNLAWAVGRVFRAAQGGGAAAAVAEADAIASEDAAASAALAVHGADALHAVLPAGPLTLLTHCNTGALAASGRGTALGVIAELAGRRPVQVLATETRPLRQGARLTVWELRRLGIPHALVVDSAAAGLIRRGEVHAVVTGFDRVAGNGDVANKVGTYPLALAAYAAGIPFVVAGPSSSVDLALASGDDIRIEERDAAEVRGSLPADTPCRNPAFDVTPAQLVWGVVTERGVARPASSITTVA
jgi:S-methyl-5-thioribose-1-phosphate isomerase